MAEQANDNDFPVPVGLSSIYTGQVAFWVLPRRPSVVSLVLVVIVVADDDVDAVDECGGGGDGGVRRSWINCNDCKKVWIKSRCCGYNVGYGKYDERTVDAVGYSMFGTFRVTSGCCCCAFTASGLDE
jgi:hypothetical protein